MEVTGRSEAGSVNSEPGVTFVGASVGGTEGEVAEPVRRRLHLPAVSGMRADSTGAQLAALSRIARRLGMRDAGDDAAAARAEEVPVTATLRPGEADLSGAAVPRPDVFVEVEGLTVGELPNGYAPMWHPTLLRAAEAGAVVTCDAVIRWRGEPSLALRLVGPEHLRLMLSAPSWAEPLVPESCVTISGAQLSQETLARVTRRMVDWVTLHPITMEGGKHDGEPGIEVRVEGERVGEFSPTSSARYRPLIEAVEEDDKVALARARLRYGRAGDIDVLLPRPVA